MSVESLIKQWRQGDRQALARLLTLTARGQNLAELRAALDAIPAVDGRVVAITGGAGVGKSTLVGKLIELIRLGGKTVAVLACDPESPLTGGALLGDRFRMSSRPEDLGVFIRSLAASGGRGAIALHLDLMVRLLQHTGFDWVLVETVGAGQGETAVRQIADLVVVLVQPEAGDDIQWEKAGLLEIADVVVVHKSDLPRADQVESQVRSLLNLPGCREMPVLRVSATSGEGLKDLYELMQKISPSQPSRRDAQALLELAQRHVGELFAQRRQQLGPVLDRWRRLEISDSEAAAKVLDALADK